MTQAVVTIFGGSGFVGRHLVKRLATLGWVVRVAVRHPNQAEFLRVMGDPGQIVAIHADLMDPESIKNAGKFDSPSHNPTAAKNFTSPNPRESFFKNLVMT